MTKSKLKGNVKNEIGFAYNTKNVKGIQVWHIEFLKELYNIDNHTERYGATGYTKISKITGIDRNECQKFRAFLENIKILKSESNKNILIELNLKNAIRKVSQKLEDIGGI